MKIKNEQILYVHVGYQKTATTFLQEKIFSKHKQINYLGKTENNYSDWLIKWRYLDDYAFEKNYKLIREKILLKYKEGKVNLVSSEAFIKTGGEIYSQAKRIKKVWPNTKIIIVLRDPIDYIFSFYKYSVEHDGFLLNIEDTIDWKRTPLVFYKKKPIYLPDLFYNETIEIYEKIFGASNIIVLKYEDMVNNSEFYFKKLGLFLKVKFDNKQICKSLNIKTNVSKDVHRIKYLQAKNLFTFLRKQTPNTAKKISINQIEKEIKGEILGQNLRERLGAYFKGKCYDYY